MERKLKKTLLLVSTLLIGQTNLFSATTATQTFNIEVSAINEISVSGSPGALAVDTATAGVEPTDDTDASTTYAVTTNDGTDGKKITAAVNTTSPTGVTLSITLAALSGSTSSGKTTLDTSAADVVTGLDSIAATGGTITYTLNATVSAGVVAAASRTVTLTLADT